MSTQAAYTLLEINQYIRRVIALNFDQPLWIECEIGQASVSRGHWYLDLIQKEKDTIVAQTQAAMWANVYVFLKRKLPVAPEDILRQGMAVKLKVNIDFHERYGLKLIIEDIDCSFTIGVLEMQRQAILLEIKQRDLIRKNACTHLPSVVQRLAIISSDRAAGWIDFVKHIEDNSYGYHISIDLFEAAMQGQQVESEVLACLQKIAKKKSEYDAVAIIRGGGGRTDLAAFDNLVLAVCIAEYPIPVLIGIGHEIDQSALDLVAYRSLKTPTAVADFIVEHNSEFESKLDEVWHWITDEAYDRIRLENQKITDLATQLHHAVKARLILESNQLNHRVLMLKQWTKNTLQTHNRRIEFIDSLLRAIDPDKVLSRGYSITSKNGKTITRATDLHTGETIQTTFHEGMIKSVVE
jgi:exodeoxyribonuclease VII large subunit